MYIVSLELDADQTPFTMSPMDVVGMANPTGRLTVEIRGDLQRLGQLAQLLKRVMDGEMPLSELEQ